MIPNILHFVFLESPARRWQFGLTHYLAIKSAQQLNQPEAIYLHCNAVPSGYWWDQVCGSVTINKIEPPKNIHGNDLCHPAHQADVVRLEMLRKFGGVYLDLDTISVKPLHAFYTAKFAMGQQLEPPSLLGVRMKVKCAIAGLSFRPFFPRVHGLCNAVMLSERDASFVNLWLDSYRTFRSRGEDEYWDEHSIRKPLELYKRRHTGLTKLSPYAFHFPLWDAAGLSLLFEQAHIFKEAYVHHLWESKSSVRFLSRLTPELISAQDTTYNILARKYF